VVQRVEQRTDDNGRDELEATEWLLRSSNRDVITIGVFHGDGAEHRITFKRRKEVVPAALATKRRTWRARGSNWLTVIACRQPGTEWRGVSPTTEGRRERPVAGGRDRTRATGPAATNRGSAATFRWWARPPPNVWTRHCSRFDRCICNSLLVAAQGCNVANNVATGCCFGGAAAPPTVWDRAAGFSGDVRAATFASTASFAGRVGSGAKTRSFRIAVATEAISGEVSRRCYGRGRGMRRCHLVVGGIDQVVQ
jgi:hypothetical protein